jgi:hypothetical protein
MSALKPCLGPGEKLPLDDRLDNALAAWHALPWWRKVWEWVKSC